MAPPPIRGLGRVAARTAALGVALAIGSVVVATGTAGAEGTERFPTGIPIPAATLPWGGLSPRPAGPTGPARTLALLDGVPVDDPFGLEATMGWSWGRPLARVDLSLGPSPLAWGTGTTAGSVHLISAGPPPALFLDTAGGSHATTGLGLFGVARTGTGTGTGLIEARWLESEGFPVVREDQRGPVDVSADRTRGLGGAGLAYRLGSEGWASLAGQYLVEEEGLGTSRGRRDLVAGRGVLALRLGRVPAGQWDAVATVSRQESRAAVPSPEADRVRDRVGLSRTVPADAASAAVQWTRRFLRQSGEPGPHLFVAGADVRVVEGESAEGGDRPRRAGGRAWQIGLYGHDVDTIFPWLEVLMGFRAMYWRSEEGFVTGAGGGPGGRRRLPPRDSASLMQRTALRVTLAERLTLSALVAEAFRPPTLFEQYGADRVRDDVTAPNPRLDPERPVEGEVSIEYRAVGGLALRAGGFWTEVFDAIASVTLSSTAGDPVCPPTGTCRRRQNLDRARVVGVELAAEYETGGGFAIELAYRHQQSRVERAAVAHGLVGRELAGVARDEAALRVRRVVASGLTLEGQVRYLGPRFDDDRNRFRVRGQAVLELGASLPLSQVGELFLTVDNALDATVERARTSDGVVTVGAPRSVQGGVRLRF